MEGRFREGLADLFTSVVKGDVELDSDEEQENPEDVILPFLKTFGIVSRTVTLREVCDEHFRQLACRWGIKSKDPKTMKERKRDQLVAVLIDCVESNSKSIPGGFHRHLAAREEAERAKERERPQNKKNLGSSTETTQTIPPKSQKKKITNYFGLPDYAYAASDLALVYKARKTTDELDKEDKVERLKKEKQAALLALQKEQGQGGQGGLTPLPAAKPKTPTEKSSRNVAAQRKVAEALVTMSKNDTMVKHFMHKGGIDAVVKLIGDSDDKIVLMHCAGTLLEVSNKAEFCKILVDKFIVSSLQTLVEKGDLEVRLMTVQVMTNLTYQENLRGMLVLAGIIPLVQLLIALSDSHDVLCFCMLVTCNVATVLEVLPDLELAVKICMQCSKSLEIKDNYTNALFAVEIFVNFTRCFQYGALLCEEGLLPLIMSMLETHMTSEMIGKVSEALVNLSTTRKNRREIANCGIGLFLDRVFSLGAPDNRADILSMIGNLLTSGYFHDKIAREETISTMLNQLLDPKQTKQFVSVSYCLAQMAQVETSAKVMIKCELVPITLNLLPDTPVAAMENMWTVLVALSQQPMFFENLVSEKALIQEMYKEVSSEEGSKVTELIAQIAFNLSLRTDLVNFLSQSLIEMYVDMLKSIYSNNGIKLRATALNTLINFCTYAKSSRVPLLGYDLISTLEEAGIDDATMNVRYAALINILSMEENLPIKLLDGGAQKLLVAMQGSISVMPSYVAQVEKRKKMRGAGILDATTNKPPVPTVIDADLGKAITAATLHNLSLKRPVMGPGVLMTLMSLLKNCKTSRILHVTRTLANVSTHPRAKLALAKERRLIPLLTSTMRGGCDEADRVQHYCSLAICNVLAVQIDRPIMEELCKNGAITDLVVCTLLRINSVYTKESLAKALFNLMARADFRFEMVSQIGVLSAMIELAKIENVELLELCIRNLYNITCESAAYANKMADLKIPNILISRITSSPNIAGAKPTMAVKFLCAMALANISFEPSLVVDMLFDKSIPNAAFCMFQLNSDEATYCTAIMLSNLSKYPDVKNLADSVVVPLLVSILQRGPASSTQMAVTTLTNFSMINVFYDQLVAQAMAPMVEIMSQPAVHSGIKMEALQYIYNLCTLHTPACIPAIMSEISASLWKVCKGIGSNPEGHEGTISRIARIVKEICGAAAESQEALKKLLADGVMSIILKLSKYEIPTIKLDLSYAIYSLSQGPEALKVLQWDGVDILFWLTLHDCLGLYDPIRKNVSRAMRNFSSSGDRGAGAILLAKEERSMTILRCLARSTNEDVQWQAAGTVYCVLSVLEAQPDLLSRGVIQLLLDLAAGGYQGVNHVCSACLHLCPSENLPDLSDPSALQLVLCLLEVEGDKFALLGEKSNDMIPYVLSNTNKASDFVADPTPFTASWVCIACEVDSIFSPALVPFPAGNYKELPPPRPSSSQNALSRRHITLNGSEFNYFGVRENHHYTEQEDENAAGQTGPGREGDGEGGGGGAGPGGGRIGSSSGGPATGDRGNRWAFNPVTTENRGGVGTTSGHGNDEYVPVEPEQASQIAFPKIYQRKEIPSDTLGAIYGSSSKGTKPTARLEESVTLNKHANRASRG